MAEINGTIGSMETDIEWIKKEMGEMKTSIGDLYKWIIGSGATLGIGMLIIIVKQFTGG